MVDINQTISLIKLDEYQQGASVKIRGLSDWINIQVKAVFRNCASSLKTKLYIDRLSDYIHNRKNIL